MQNEAVVVRLCQEVVAWVGGWVGRNDEWGEMTSGDGRPGAR